MFKKIRPQEAVDDERGLNWGSVSVFQGQLESRGRVLFVAWEDGSDDAGEYLSIIYLPEKLHWEAPNDQEPIGLMERQEIKAQIEEAAAVLDYRVKFVDEAPLVV